MSEYWSEEKISAYLDGQLTIDEQAQVEAHLAEHPTDAETLREFKLLRTQLKRAPRFQLGDEFTQRVLHQVGTQPIAPPVDRESLVHPTQGIAGLEKATQTTMGPANWRAAAATIAALAATLILVLVVAPVEDYREFADKQPASDTTQSATEGVRDETTESGQVGDVAGDVAGDGQWEADDEPMAAPPSAANANPAKSSRPESAANENSKLLAAQPEGFADNAPGPVENKIAGASAARDSGGRGGAGFGNFQRGFAKDAPADDSSPTRLGDQVKLADAPQPKYDKRGLAESQTPTRSAEPLAEIQAGDRLDELAVPSPLGQRTFDGQIVYIELPKSALGREALQKIVFADAIEHPDGADLTNRVASVAESVELAPGLELEKARKLAAGGGRQILAPPHAKRFDADSGMAFVHLEATAEELQDTLNEIGGRQWNMELVVGQDGNQLTQNARIHNLIGVPSHTPPPADREIRLAQAPQDEDARANAFRQPSPPIAINDGARLSKKLGSAAPEHRRKRDDSASETADKNVKSESSQADPVESNKVAVAKEAATEAKKPLSPGEETARQPAAGSRQSPETRDIASAEGKNRLGQADANADANQVQNQQPDQTNLPTRNRYILVIRLLSDAVDSASAAAEFGSADALELPEAQESAKSKANARAREKK